ncbi:hypothetical protein Tco_0492645 [Tanacetum coccineum]
MALYHFQPMDVDLASDIVEFQSGEGVIGAEEYLWVWVAEVEHSKPGFELRSKNGGKGGFRVKMDDPNITMEEYIRLEEEKARRRGKVYNWETATYGKIWDNEDVHDLGSVENEFPAIVFNDTLISKVTQSCEPTVSSLNDEVDFKISFDNSDDEDYTIIFDKNSFSYKIISTNDLKTDSETDNEKVNMPSFPSPEPTVNCFNDLDFFKDFENEFPAIVYNDAPTSKSDLLTEQTLNPQHIDEFDFKDETSLPEYDEEEQNVLYFNDLFPFNIIQPDDLKSEKDNDDNEIDKIHSSGGGGDLVNKNDDVGGESQSGSFEVLEFDTSKRLFNLQSLLIISTWRIYRVKY